MGRTLSNDRAQTKKCTYIKPSLTKTRDFDGSPYVYLPPVGVGWVVGWWGGGVVGWWGGGVVGWCGGGVVGWWGGGVVGWWGGGVVGWWGGGVVGWLGGWGVVRSWLRLGGLV